MPFASCRNLNRFIAGAFTLAKVGVLFIIFLLNTLLSNYFIFYAEFVEAMVEAYPNLKILWLYSCNPFLNKRVLPDGNAVISTFRFPHLTTLSLRNFQLLDGSALISVKWKVSLIYYSSSLNLVVFRSSKDPRSWRWFSWRQILFIHLLHQT